MKLATLCYVVACASFTFGFLMACIFSIGRIAEGGRH